MAVLNEGSTVGGKKIASENYVDDAVGEHANDTTKHITASERTKWDEVDNQLNIKESLNAGANASAKGQYSVALGANASAGGDLTTALGYNASAKESFAIALGYGTSASSNTIALGRNASADANFAVSIGKSTVAQGENSIAVGYESSAVENGSIAIGSETSAVGLNSTSIGYVSVAAGESSVALGDNASADASNSVAIGMSSLSEGANGISIGNGSRSHGTSVSIGIKAYTSVSGVAIGRYSETTHTNSVAIGGAKTSTSNEGVLGGDSVTNKWIVPGDFTVNGTKNFEIPHPHPDKRDTHRIRHGAVESPTEGDTLYRYEVEAAKDGETVELQLPDYFEYLNKDIEVWVNGVKHFGRAFADVEGDTLKVTCETAGKYRCLVIGTRNDDHDSVQDWQIKGVEREIGESWTGEPYNFTDDYIVSDNDEIFEEVI